MDFCFCVFQVHDRYCNPRHHYLINRALTINALSDNR
jgi:hypothetical protein